MAPFWRYLHDKQLQRRVTLLVALVVAGAVIGSNLAGYLALRAALMNASEGLAVKVASDLSSTATSDLASTNALSVQLKQPAGVVVEAVSTSGAVLRVPGETTELVPAPDDAQAAGSSGRELRRIGASVDGTPYAIALEPLPGTDYALVVGRPLVTVYQLLSLQQLILLCVSAASVLAAVVAGGFAARSGLRPVRQLTRAVQHVTETKDMRPVSVRHATGEMAALAASFNQMLQSVSRSRERQARLVADAGHELRNPLASLSANVDLLASDVGHDRLTHRQRVDIFGDVQVQLGELNGLVRDLVQLARDEQEVPPAPLDLRDVVEAALERVRRRGQDRIFDVELGQLFMVGHADALERAIINLLDNAVKWSPPGGTIRVRLEGNRLRVSDEGPGIPEQDLPYIFDRFFRGESARKTHGTGLGLSIVAKAVEDNGGTVQAGRSATGGAEFTLQLPGVTNREALSAVLIPVS